MVVENGILKKVANSDIKDGIFHFPDGIVIISENAFSGVFSIEKIDIPEGVIEIGADAFAYCIELTDVYLPTSLRRICSRAFFYCNSLCNIHLNDGLQVIDSSAFCHCKNLSEVSLPSTLIELGTYAFEDCESLKRVELPDSTDFYRFSYGVFDGCINLEDIKFADKRYPYIDICGQAFNKCSKLGEFSIPSLSVTIADDAFDA